MAISLEQIVKVNPSVIATGANALAMNTVLLELSTDADWLVACFNFTRRRSRFLRNRAPRL